MQIIQEFITPAVFIVALALGGYGLRRIRQAGENITLDHERRAFEALVKRNQQHAAEKAREKAFKEVGPMLRKELVDYRNPTSPAFDHGIWDNQGDKK